MDYTIENPVDTDYIRVLTEDGSEVGRFDPEGFETPSTTTEDATINGTDEDDPRERIKRIDVSGVSSISESVSLDNTEHVDYIIEVDYYEDNESTADNSLTVTLQGIGDGNYEQTQKDESGTYTDSAGENQYTLIEPTSTSSSDRHVGKWTLKLLPTSQAIVTGGGGPAVAGAGRYLDTGYVSNFAAPDDPFDLTFSASASGNDLTLLATVYKTQDRSTI